MSTVPRSVAAEAHKVTTERLVAAITLHHERCKTLGLNYHRGNPQWGGPWDHELWATVGLPSGPSVEPEKNSIVHVHGEGCIYTYPDCDDERFSHNAASEGQS